jgi:hypothetical protein
MFSAAVRDDSDEDDGSDVMEELIAEDSFDRRRGRGSNDNGGRNDNPLDESIMLPSDAEEPWSEAFVRRTGGGGGGGGGGGNGGGGGGRGSWRSSGDKLNPLAPCPLTLNPDP